MNHLLISRESEEEMHLPSMRDFESCSSPEVLVLVCGSRSLLSLARRPRLAVRGGARVREAHEVK